MNEINDKTKKIRRKKSKTISDEPSKKVKKTGQKKQKQVLKGGYDINPYETPYVQFIFFIKDVFESLLHKISSANYTFAGYFATTFCRYLEFIEEIQDYLLTSSYVQDLFKKKVDEFLKVKPEYQLSYDIMNINVNILHQFLYNIFSDAQLNYDLVQYISNTINTIQTGGKQTLSSALKKTIASSRNLKKRRGGMSEESPYLCIVNAIVLPLVDAIRKTNTENIVQVISENSLLMNVLMQPENISIISEYILNNHIKYEKLVLIENFTTDNIELLDKIFDGLGNVDTKFLRSEIKNEIKLLLNPNHQRGLKSTATMSTRALTNVVTNPFGNNVFSLRANIQKLTPILQELIFNLQFIDDANVTLQ